MSLRVEALRERVRRDEYVVDPRAVAGALLRAVAARKVTADDRGWPVNATSMTGRLMFAQWHASPDAR